MKIENQVCSLEHAKKIKELGIQVSPRFIWKYQKTKCSGKNHPKSEHPDKFLLIVDPRRERSMDESETKHYAELEKQGLIYPALTVAELGELLAPGLERFETGISTHFGEWNGGRCMIELLNNGKVFFGETEADARAEVVIYVREKHLNSEL